VGGIGSSRGALTDDAAYNVVMAVASGALPEVGAIADVLAGATASWS